MRGRKPSTIAASSSMGHIHKPPTWLSAPAKAEWKRVIPTLLDRRILTDADLATFANYCSATGEVIAASKIIAVEGMIYLGTSGPKRHPAVGIRNDAMTQARQLAAELGLTPVSRSRPTIRDDDKSEDDDDLGLE